MTIEQALKKTVDVAFILRSLLPDMPINAPLDVLQKRSKWLGVCYPPRVVAKHEFVDDLPVAIIGGAPLLRSVPRHVVEEHLREYEARAEEKLVRR